MNKIKILSLGGGLAIVLLTALGFWTMNEVNDQPIKTLIMLDEVRWHIKNAQLGLLEYKNKKDSLLLNEIASSISWAKASTKELRTVSKPSLLNFMAETGERFIRSGGEITEAIKAKFRSKDSINSFAFAELSLKLDKASDLFNRMRQQTLIDDNAQREIKNFTIAVVIVLLVLFVLISLGITVINSSRKESEITLVKQERSTQTPNKYSMPEIPLYVVSSIFLKDCYRYLTQGEPEWMHAVTGVRFGYIYTLEKMLKIAADHQSVGGVIGNPNSVADALVYLHERGHCLHAVFHSHRFNGIPSPSGTDRAFQSRLDAGNFPTIQAIFSEDGYVRFFSGVRAFEVYVFGKGVEKINERVYKIEIS